MDRDVELNESLIEKNDHQQIYLTKSLDYFPDTFHNNLTNLSSNQHHFSTVPSFVALKRVYWGTALICSFIWGTANFLYGLLHDKGFEVACLSWSGFIFSGLIYKIYMLITLAPHLNRHTIHDSFFGEVRKRGNNIHVTIRSINFVILIWI